MKLEETKEFLRETSEVMDEECEPKPNNSNLVADITGKLNGKRRKQ